MWCLVQPLHSMTPVLESTRAPSDASHAGLACLPSAERCTVLQLLLPCHVASIVRAACLGGEVKAVHPLTSAPRSLSLSMAGIPAGSCFAGSLWHPHTLIQNLPAVSCAAQECALPSHDCRRR